MIVIADATFLTYMGLIDVKGFEEIEVASIAWAVTEANYNLKDEVVRLKIQKHVKIINAEKKIVEASYPNLSHVDKALLQTCVERKNECVLITDDGLLAKVADKHQVLALTTPAYLEFLAKNKQIEKKQAINWLNALHAIYHRPRTVEKTIERVKKI